MKRFYIQNLRTTWQEIPKRRELSFFKIWILCSFIAGIVVFFFLGKEFVENSDLLDTDALKQIRDNAIDKKEFFQYVLAKRLLVLAAGILAWWWCVGKWYLYGVLTYCSFMMGACLFISMARYPFTGLFLWFFLYFPHMLFYTASLFCAMIVGTGKFHTREEKIKYILQQGLLVCVVMLCYVVGIYCESYWNVSLLQGFLKYF